MIQDTLSAVTQENVQQLADALKAIWDENNLTVSLLEKSQREGTVATIDMDLSGMPASKKAEEAEKGYFSVLRPNLLDPNTHYGSLLITPPRSL
ncbi:hypothetical protein ACFL6S_18020 [Candidatus Poribacteria bacterium]